MSVPLIDIGKLSEPLTKLVECLSAGCGQLYGPLGTVRQAKADGQALRIKAQAEAECLEIQTRARHRAEHIEVVRQQNLDRVAALAALELPEQVSEEPVDQGWTLQFVSGAQDVCDEDMRVIWARILAGEVAKPGTFFKRTLDFLRTLEKWEAEMFSALSCVVIHTDTDWPYIVSAEATYDYMREIAQNANLIAHFKTIGLINSDELVFKRSSLLERRFTYFEKPIVFRGAPMEGRLGIEPFISMESLSAIGKQLFGIANAKPIAGYLEKLSSSLQKDFAKLTVESE